MRVYSNRQENVLAEMKCNCCGKEMKVENGFLREGGFHVEYNFGYFSNKDGMKHVWDLCEECYDKIISNFKISVDESENRELL
jgi:ribosomal-protein-alanine N-acetyltransferase